MKINYVMVMVILLVSLITNEAVAQSENFKLGKQAYSDGRHRDAIKHLQIAVSEEKFFMKGKEIPLAYAYLAIIKNKYLKTSLKNNDLSMIKSNPGILSSSIEDVKSAVEFGGENPSSTVIEAQKLVTDNAYALGKIITNGIMETEDFENANDDVKYLAGILNYELNSFSDIDSNTWEIHDMLGFSHYLLGEKDLAMLDFKRAREMYQAIDTQEVTELHLYNYIYSTNYQFKQAKNYIETEIIISDGIDYIEKMAHTPGYDNLETIKRLSTIEGTFSKIKNQLIDVSSISSVKD